MHRTEWEQGWGHPRWLRGFLPVSWVGNGPSSGNWTRRNISRRKETSVSDVSVKDSREHFCVSGKILEGLKPWKELREAAF